MKSRICYILVTKVGFWLLGLYYDEDKYFKFYKPFYWIAY